MFYGSGFRVRGSGFRVVGIGRRDKNSELGLGCRIYGEELSLQGLGYML
jgi:hypothetical protein